MIIVDLCLAVIVWRIWPVHEATGWSKSITRTKCYVEAHSSDKYWVTLEAITFLGKENPTNGNLCW